ncbi:MAG TPA: DNA polymerase ligase N-terminal domain-containing protein, partial [Flavisolibacter sp.]|nr:DNA polymerase ligase N-terminal domain-containing protein [Flavisolibacter sp.]
MSLSQYRQKRNFRKTEEPKGKEKSSNGSLRFVVQKHDATTVHYDFRLEMEGVLKSWAVPKGPSLNPADKRLAMAVEDHPYDYRNFEGVIPEGEYGGGTVIVWDEGTYTPSGADGLSRKEQEELLLHNLAAGKISFVLQGQKLQGEFTLFRMKGRQKNAWMLVKKKDEWSGEDDIALKTTSVKSGHTLAEVAAEHGTTLHHPEESSKAQTTVLQKAPFKKSTRAKNKTKSAAIVETASPEKLPVNAKAKHTVMPHKIAPMLATLVEEPFNNDDWIFEIKWDGYRAVAYCNKAKVELLSRNQKSFTKKYEPVAKALAGLKLEAVFDGEIVAVDKKGLANFQALQNWQ